MKIILKKLYDIFIILLSGVFILWILVVNTDDSFPYIFEIPSILLIVLCILLLRRFESFFIKFISMNEWIGKNPEERRKIGKDLYYINIFFLYVTLFGIFFHYLLNIFGLK